MKLELVQINLLEQTVNYRLVDPAIPVTADQDPVVLRGTVRVPFLADSRATLGQIFVAAEAAVLAHRTERVLELRSQATKIEAVEIRGA